MKLGIIADVHANGPALDAVLAALDDRGVDGLVCVGDLAGVLGSPDEVVSRIRDRSDATVYGNHDSRLFPDREFLPQRDVEVAEYEQMTDELAESNLEWIQSLPATETFENVFLAHSSPLVDDPSGSTGDDSGVAPKNFVALGAGFFGNDVADGCTILAIGHSHEQHAVDVGKFDGVDEGLIVNPGPVGYPYGECSNTGTAHYAVVDTETRSHSLCSVEYDNSSVTSHLYDCGLLPTRSSRR